ncbi:DUF350 domain-containing protein [Hwanghaeella sp.]|uniref:DUF350 domain-containing protein n=1 Tax=Hwanghaeella sp. TaxID=2605943 RepID=UPI003CCBE185
MEPVLLSLWSGLPVLLLHIVATLLLLGIGLWFYEKVTPYKELALIRAGNLAASITFAGAILGISIPLAFAMNASLGLLDLLVWGTVTIILQAVAYLIVDFVMKDMQTRIEANEVAPAIVMMAAKLAVGAVVAAAVAG